MSSNAHRVGFSLIEVVIFIVVLGIGIAGVVVLFNRMTEASVDPMERKQTLALGREWCDCGSRCVIALRRTARYRRCAHTPSQNQ